MRRQCSVNAVKLLHRKNLIIYSQYLLPSIKIIEGKKDKILFDYMYIDSRWALKRFLKILLVGESRMMRGIEFQTLGPITDSEFWVTVNRAAPGTREFRLRVL